jgi:hypothetical protein
VDDAGARSAALCDAIGCCGESGAALAFVLLATAPKDTPLICGLDGFAVLRVSVVGLVTLLGWLESCAGGTVSGCNCGFARAVSGGAAVSMLFGFGSIIRSAVGDRAELRVALDETAGDCEMW